MLERKFEDFVRANSLFSRDDKLFLAISGGKDSMCLLNLLLRNNYSNITLLHANYGLRGDESNEDQRFLESYALENKIPLRCKKFDTTHYAREKGLSIQEAARDLRYQWFWEMCMEFKGYCLTAHHRDDQAETVLLNLIRGTGLKGINSLRNKNKYLIRPLLFASAEMIEEYVSQHWIPYREDSSNSKNDYSRNKLRNKIMPIMKEINPAAAENISKFSSVSSQAEDIIKAYLNEKEGKLFFREKDLLRIDLNFLSDSPGASTLAFYLISDFGFGPEVAEYLCSGKWKSGRYFKADKFLLRVDRNECFIQPHNGMPVFQEQIEGPGDYGIIKVEEIGSIEDENIYSSEFAFLDASFVTFPLVLRNWKEGDKFQPFGMKGTKNLSDYFTDKKLNTLQKQKSLVLESDGKIIWVVGQRIDDRYKCSVKTKKILKITFYENADPAF